MHVYLCSFSTRACPTSFVLFSLPLKARFRALFALRNVGDDRSVEWIGKCLNDESALLKHELAYCLGQMQNKSAIPILVKTLEDVNQGKTVSSPLTDCLG